MHKEFNVTNEYIFIYYVGDIVVSIREFVLRPT